MVYGESNAGKTFWTTDLACHVAAGKKWNGRRVEQGGVVYCALEGGMGFKNRVAAWKRKHAPDMVLPFAAIPASLNLLDPEADTQKLIQTIKEAWEGIETPVRLIVIDTLSRALAGGNENAPDDMGALVSNMDTIRQATHASVLFIHHSGKDTAKGARGHSLLRAAIDTEIEVVAGDQVHTATVVKQRELPKGDVFGFRLDVVEIGKNRYDEPVTTCLVEPTEAKEEAPKTKLTGQSSIALQVLKKITNKSGRVGYSGTPSYAVSVPDEWWREHFYSEAMPGEAQDTKRKAFKRATELLIERHLVGMANNRVWIEAEGATGDM